jgi:hypothetical protein
MTVSTTQRVINVKGTRIQAEDPHTRRITTCNESFFKKVSVSCAHHYVSEDRHSVVEEDDDFEPEISPRRVVAASAQPHNSPPRVAESHTRSAPHCVQSRVTRFGRAVHPPLWMSDYQ